MMSHGPRSPVVPAALQGDDRVAIATAHVALSDFLVDPGDAETVCDQPHDVAALLSSGAMIEIEDSEIRVAAVDARMSEQVLSQE
jgi:hypothetical protein